MLCEFFVIRGKGTRKHGTERLAQTWRAEALTDIKHILKLNLPWILSDSHNIQRL